MAINQRKIIQASYGVTEVEGANINRSPSSYEKMIPNFWIDMPGLDYTGHLRSTTGHFVYQIMDM